MPFTSIMSRWHRKALNGEKVFVCENKLVNFADDSTLVFGGGGRDDGKMGSTISRRMAKRRLSKCAADFLVWLVGYCKDLHLTFSVGKTACLHFWEKHEVPVNIPVVIDCPELDVFHGKELKTLHEDPVRLLGFYLNPFLNFNAHIDKVVKKCDVGINMMRGLASTSWGMRGKLLKVIFNGLIESVLFYGLEIFRHAALKKRNL